MSSAPSYTPRLLPLRMPRVCVAVTGADASEMMEKAEALVRDNPFLEFRLDYLAKPGLAIPKIKAFMESHPGTVAIATCRRTPAGGRLPGSMASELDILAKASAADCHLPDVGLEDAIRTRPPPGQQPGG